VRAAAPDPECDSLSILIEGKPATDGRPKLSSITAKSEHETMFYLIGSAAMVAAYRRALSQDIRLPADACVSIHITEKPFPTMKGFLAGEETLGSGPMHPACLALEISGFEFPQWLIDMGQILPTRPQCRRREPIVE
jgi:hypothetical protein